MVLRQCTWTFATGFFMALAVIAVTAVAPATLTVREVFADAGDVNISIGKVAPRVRWVATTYFLIELTYSN
jgi:hypothetical protein